MSHKLTLWICLWLILQYNAVMVHLVIGYQVLLLITAVAALILIQIGKTKIGFLKPFFWSYLFFTLIILLDLSIIYFSSNISIKPTYTGFYGYVIVQSLLFYLFYIFLLLTQLKLLNKKRGKKQKIIIIAAIITLPFVVSPICIIFSADLKNIIFKKTYFLFIIPYLVLSFYSTLLLIKNYRLNLIKMTSRIFIPALGLFTIICFFQAIAAFIYKFNNPVISMKINVDSRGFIESNLGFLFLSISIIIFIVKHLTLKKKLPDITTLLSLGLTPREAELAILIIKGLNNQDIANKLFISVSTVKTHINNIFRKTGAESRVDFMEQMSSL